MIYPFFINDSICTESSLRKAFETFTDTGYQLFGIERFRKIVVGTYFEAFQAVGLVGSVSQEEFHKTVAIPSANKKVPITILIIGTRDFYAEIMIGEFNLQMQSNST